MEYKLILDQSLLNEYNDYYFTQHPRAKKIPIERPIPPSLNQWIILPRMQMNALKQRWKDFGIWWIQKLGYCEKKLERFTVAMTIYMPTKRRADCDNQCGKFLWDAFTEAGLIVDDDYRHMESLLIKIGYDKEWPRTEILLKTID